MNLDMIGGEAGNYLWLIYTWLGIIMKMIGEWNGRKLIENQIELIIKLDMIDDEAGHRCSKDDAEND